MELRKNSHSEPIHPDLSQLPPRCEAIVASIDAPPRLASRLRDLGFLPGATLRVLRSGSALIVQIGETRLALRRRDAAAIRLAP
jgi:Fe2+ transport system protein FeoA